MKSRVAQRRTSRHRHWPRLMGMMNGQEFFLFPTATFKAKETLGTDVACSGEQLLDEKLLEELKSSQFGYIGFYWVVQDDGKGGLSLRGGNRHDRNRRNRRNRQNRHGRLFVLYFVGQAKGGQGALQNRRNRQNRQNRHEGYPPETQPPFSVILSSALDVFRACFGAVCAIFGLCAFL